MALCDGRGGLDAGGGYVRRCRCRYQHLARILVIAEMTGKFILEREVKVKMCDSMIPLTHRTAGGVMTPLRDS